MERSIEHFGMKPEIGIIVYALHYDNGDGEYPVARAHACAAAETSRERELEELLWEEGRSFLALSAESAAKGHPVPTNYILARSEYLYDGGFHLKSCRVLAALQTGKEKAWGAEE